MAVHSMGLLRPEQVLPTVLLPVPPPRNRRLLQRHRPQTTRPRRLPGRLHCFRAHPARLVCCSVQDSETVFWIGYPWRGPQHLRRGHRRGPRTRPRTHLASPCCEVSRRRAHLQDPCRPGLRQAPSECRRQNHRLRSLMLTPGWSEAGRPESQRPPSSVNLPAYRQPTSA